MPSHFASTAIPCIALVLCTSAAWAQQPDTPSRLAPKGFRAPADPGGETVNRPGTREPGPAPIGGFINCTQPLGNCQDLITANASTSNDVDFISADDFRTAADGVISSVCWWGAYIPAPAANAFTVTFYLDLGLGLPGPIVGGPFVEGLTLLGLTQRDTGLLVAGIVPIFEYTASLGAPFPVASTVCYWIEVKNAVPAGTNWFWEWSNSANGGNGVFVQDGAPPNGYDASDFAFGNDLAWCINLTLDDPFTCIPINGHCRPGGVANDCCVDRTPIFNGKTEFSTVGARTDGPGEGACTAGPGPTNDIWYNYNADFTGDLTVTTCEELNGSADFDTVLVVYGGCNCDPLGPILGCNDDDPDNACGTAAGGFKSTITVRVVAGNCYKIRLGGFSGAGTGVLDLTKLSVEPCSPGGVSYNCCADRTPVFNGETEFSTIGATTDGPAHSACQFDGQTYRDIWFNYTSTFTGDVLVSTCDRAEYDTDLVVYDGCDCGALVLLGCNDDAGGCAGFSSEVTVPVVAGNCYKIRVGGFQDGDQGSGTLNLDQVVPLNNDNCADRRDIFNGKTEFTTEGASTDGPGVPCTPIGPVNDIWFNYNSTFTGDLEFTTCEQLNGSANFDTVLVVYDGCGCDPLAPILGCNDDDPNNPCGTGGGGFHSTVSVPVTAGKCYKIRLGGFAGGSAGSGILSINGRPDDGGGPLDIKPGSCPNPFNRNANGKLPVALIGSADFDVSQVDISTLEISRADGVGGSVSPNEGPPGPHTHVADVATPFDGDLCDCHELEGDGIPDLMSHYSRPAMTAALELDDVPNGTFLELCVSGLLLDGTSFSACDCIRVQGPGGPPLLLIGSNIPDVYIDVTPKDDYLDGGDYTPFERWFVDGPPGVDNSPSTTLVTLTAPANHQGKIFLGWSFGGGETGVGYGQLARGTTLTLPVATETSVEAIYGSAPAPPATPGRRR